MPTKNLLEYNLKSMQNEGIKPSFLYHLTKTQIYQIFYGFIYNCESSNFYLFNTCFKKGNLFKSIFKIKSFKLIDKYLMELKNWGEFTKRKNGNSSLHWCCVRA